MAMYQWCRVLPPPPFPTIVFMRLSRYFFCNFVPNSSETTLKIPPRKGRQAVRRLLKLLRTSHGDQPVVAALETLQKSPQNLSSNEAALLVSAIRDPLISFDFYRFFRAQPCFKPQPVIYSALIQTQLNSINPKWFKIQFYLDEMKKHKITLTQINFCRLIDSLLPNNTEIAEFLIQKLMKEPSFDPADSLEAYNSVISVYTKYGFFDKALGVVEKAKSEIENLNCEFYCNVMNIHRASGNPKAAMKTFLDMEDKGILADGKIYSNLLGSLCSSGTVRCARAILDEMKKIGLKPDEASARDLMRAYLKENLVSEAEQLFKEGILKDQTSLAVFIETIAEKQSPSRAAELLRTMRGSGLEVADYVYVSLLHRCGDVGLVEDAERIFAEIKSSKKTTIGLSMYLSMLYVYSKAEIRNSAEMIWEEIQVQGVGRHVEAYMYMMSMYGALGLVRDVVKIFDLWKQRGFDLNVHAYAILIDALSRSGKLDRARASLMEMRSYKIQPNNSIYASMMEGYLQVGLLNHAISFLDEYKISGLKVDGVVASSIAMVLLQAGKYSELESYLDVFVRQGIKLRRDKGLVLMEMCGEGSCLGKLVKLIK